MSIIKAKSILIPIKNPPEIFFGGYYNINLYRGCQHNCIYCDTRSDCYKNGELTNIRIKENALNILEKELSNKKRKGTITTGSMNDPYMPIEEKTKLTLGALKLISKYRFGVHIITKSNLVTRDIEIFKKISEIYCAISITITTSDDKLSSLIEPHAPNSSQRFNALKELSKNNIYCGITLMPTLPFITDTAKNIINIIKKAKEANIKYILFSPGMTLRDTCRDYYYKKLDELFPGIKEKYISTYNNKYSCISKNSKELEKIFHNECNKNNISTKMVFYKEKNTIQTQINKYLLNL